MKYLTIVIVFLLVPFCGFSQEYFFLMNPDHDSLTPLKTEHIHDEPYGRPLPAGPASIRHYNNEIWISDSLASRIVIFDMNCSFERDIELKVDFPGDFCLLGQDLFVIDEDNQKLVKYSEGRRKTDILKEVEGEHLIMPVQVDISPNGNILLLDYGRDLLIEIDPSGLNVIKTFKAHGQSFYVSDEYIYFTSIRQNQYALVKQDSEGQIQSKTRLKYPSGAEPMVVGLDEQGAPMIAFISFDEEALAPSFSITSTASDSIIVTYEWPLPFIRRTIPKIEGNYFFIRHISGYGDDYLRLDEISTDFSASGSSG